MKQRDLAVGRKARRSWPVAEKRRIVAETLLPGASVSIVARRQDVKANQVFKWRRELAASDRAGLPVAACAFVPIGVFAQVDGRWRRRAMLRGRMRQAYWRLTAG